MLLMFPSDKFKKEINYSFGFGDIYMIIMSHGSQRFHNLFIYFSRIEGSLQSLVPYVNNDLKSSLVDENNKLA